MRLFKFLRSRDQYGIDISPSFNKNGSTHYTYCGGITTCVVQTMISIYAVFLVKNVFELGNDTVSLVQKEVDPYDQGNLTFRDLGVMTFWIL